MQIYRSHVLVCAGTGCTSSKSGLIIEEFSEHLKKNDLENEVQVIKTGCFGLCAQGPIVVIYPEGSMYTMVTPEDVKEIVNEHLIKGRIVKRLLHVETHAEEEDQEHKSMESVEFFQKQLRIALRNCGVIDPEKID